MIERTIYQNWVLFLQVKILIPVNKTITNTSICVGWIVGSSFLTVSRHCLNLRKNSLHQQWWSAVFQQPIRCSMHEWQHEQGPRPLGCPQLGFQILEGRLPFVLSFFSSPHLFPSLANSPLFSAKSTHLW